MFFFSDFIELDITKAGMDVPRCTKTKFGYFSMEEDETRGIDWKTHTFTNNGLMNKADYQSISYPAANATDALIFYRYVYFYCLLIFPP